MADEREITLVEEPEAIRQQMAETRTALNEKLRVLEGHVTNSVEVAANSVSDTVDSLKASVRDFLDLRGHVERKPWTMVGAAVGLGFLTSWYLGSKTAGTARPVRVPVTKDEPNGASAHYTNGHAALHVPRPEHDQEERESWLAKVTSLFGVEMQDLRKLVIGAAAGLVRDVVVDIVPDTIGPKAHEVLNTMTMKLGGDPLEAPVRTPRRQPEACANPSSPTSARYGF